MYGPWMKQLDAMNTVSELRHVKPPMGRPMLRSQSSTMATSAFWRISGAVGREATPDIILRPRIMGA